MPDSGFDVVLIAVAGGRAEPPSSALARIAGIELAAAHALLETLPSVALRGVDYARAEGLAASLQLAGFEVRILRRGASVALPSERPRVTLPEIGSLVMRVRDDALRVLRRSSVRPGAPETLKPGAQVEPAVSVQSSPSPAHEPPKDPDAAPGPPAPKLASSGPEPAAGQRWLSWSEAANQNQGARVPAKADLGPAFGEGCDRELEQAVQGRRLAHDNAVAPPWSADAGRVSLGFPEPFVNADKPLAASARQPSAWEPASRPPIRKPSAGTGNFGRVPPWAKTQDEKPDLARADMFSDVRDALPARTVWLLGALWLSVALLLWANDLLF